MHNVNTVIILIFVSLCIILLFYKFREQFTNRFINPLNHVTQDLSNLEVIETKKDTFQEEINDIVDQLLQELNRLHNKQLIRINLERVEKTVVSDNLTNYEVYAFVLNEAKESTAKLKLVFSVDSADKVSVKEVDVLGSRSSILTKRQGDSGRDFTNIKRQIDMDKVKRLEEEGLDYSLVNYNETDNKMVNRNSWVLHKERLGLGPVDTFPSRDVLPKWDVFGVALTDEYTHNSKLAGLNHGTRKFTFVPNFFKSNYEICMGDYLWMFGTSEDAVSRPIGVT